MMLALTLDAENKKNNTMFLSFNLRCNMPVADGAQSIKIA